MQQGIAEISHHLWRLKEHGEITTEEYLDSDFNAAMERAVKHELEGKLSGEETPQEVEKMVRLIIDEEME